MATESTVGAISSQLPAQADQSKGGDGASGGQDLVLKVLGAVGTGIGILGFVTFFGGAIVWVRANEAGLPANEAVAVVPRGVLVTTGASFLVPAVLLALLAVMLIGTVHLGWTLVERFKARALSQKATQLRDEADEALGALRPQEQLASSARELAINMSAVLETAMHDAGAAEQIPQLRAQAEAQQKQAQTSELAACEARTKAEQLDAAALREESALGLALRNRPGLASPQRIVEYVVTLLVLTVIPLVTYGNLGDVGRLDAIILVLVAFAVAVVSVVTYLVSEKFLWLGVVAFVSVGLYTGCATYFRTIKNPKVEPAAALRGDRSPVMGFFIAETANDLYIGTFRADGIQPRLLIVPRSQVTDLAVGPLLDPHTARERAIDLAKFECRQRIEQHGKGAKPGNACTKSQETALNALRPDSRTS